MNRLIGKREGIRNFPYRFDMTINPLTYGWYNNPSWPNTAPGREAHNAGEIWASALSDMTWLLINKQE